MIDKIDIIRTDNSGQPYPIGTVEPPFDILSDSRSKDASFIDYVLQSLWNEWKNKANQPDTDEAFVNWLQDEHGWSIVDTNHAVVLQD